MFSAETRGSLGQNKTRMIDVKINLIYTGFIKLKNQPSYKKLIGIKITYSNVFLNSINILCQLLVGFQHKP